MRFDIKVNGICSYVNETYDVWSLIMMEQRTSGSFAIVASNTKKAAIPVRPMISGASTCLDDQANRTPPQVSAMTTALELAMINMQPLEDGKTSVVSRRLRLEYSHPVHPSDLLTERPRWRSQLEEGNNEQGCQASQRQIEILLLSEYGDEV